MEQNEPRLGGPPAKGPANRLQMLFACDRGRTDRRSERQGVRHACEAYLSIRRKEEKFFI